MEDHGEHNPGDHEDPLPGPTWIIGILGTVLLAVVVLGVTALFFNADSRVIDQRLMTAEYPEINQLMQQQLARIESPARIVEINENDQAIETVVIPIDQAMEKVAASGGVAALQD